ncbi:MAG TPA: protein kinase [Kofleriaceae bacterium]|nr:protein kinase [Kofleriaceae bacterium]
MFVCSECGASAPAAGRCAADGTPLAPVGEDILLGTTIGVYRVARLLGIGGMGRVYKGVHPAIGSRVAIKVLSRECSDRRDLVDRFFAEAKAVNLIRHESIVNVLDLATLPDGRPYIIMEYLDGSALASIIEHAVQLQAPLPLGGIARLTAEILDALGAAHGKGIVHRDLKPDNVFVAPSGRPKVLDFGIAKLSDVTNTSTRTGSLLGTPHYMSPEQAAGRVVDHRADIYAIGVILFECATGRKPFLAESLFDLLRMHVEVPPPSPRAMRPDLPIELEHVILTALAKPPDHRFASATAMSMALQHATSQLPPEAWRPLTPPAHQGAPSHSWAPTPPSSWSGSRSGPSPGSGAGPGLRPAQHQHPGNLSTVSAGQVTRGTRSAGSKRGLWLGLAGVLVVGGVTAAAVIGGRGGASGRTASVSGGTDPGPPGTPSTVQGSPTDPKQPDPWGGAPAAGHASPGPATSPGPAAGNAPPASSGSAAGPGAGNAPQADDDADEPHAGTPGLPPDADAALAQAMAQLDATIKALPPAQQRQLAAYRNLAKLPPRERMKRLRELTAQGLAIPGLAAGDAGAGADDPLAPAAPAGGSWVTSHHIDAPAGYDPEHLDVVAFLPWAIAQARQAIPDAQLIRIDADGVGTDGRANLVLPTLASDHGSIDIRFISPSRGKRDPKLPLGVGQKDFKCEFRIEAEPDGVDLAPIDFADCTKEHVVPVPKCSFGAVWKKAIGRKAPSHNAVGNLGYRSNGSHPVWYFDIGYGFNVAFSDMFDDNC